MHPDVELCRCVQALAQPASVQVSLFPDFAVVGDELALQFDDALRAIRALGSPLSDNQIKSLDELDRYLSELSGPQNDDFWVDRALLGTDPRWHRVRELARIVLSAFAWPNDVPGKDGAVYVSAGSTIRNL